MGIDPAGEVPLTGFPINHREGKSSEAALWPGRADGRNRTGRVGLASRAEERSDRTRSGRWADDGHGRLPRRGRTGRKAVQKSLDSVDADKVKADPDQSRSAAEAPLDARLHALGIAHDRVQPGARERAFRRRPPRSWQVSEKVTGKTFPLKPNRRFPRSRPSAGQSRRRDRRWRPGCGGPATKFLDFELELAFVIGKCAIADASPERPPMPSVAGSF